MASKSVLAEMPSLRVSRHQIPAHGLIPNMSLQGRPLMIYYAAFLNPSASVMESHLNAVGVVSPQWRYTMFSTTQFHSTTHEVLCVAHGKAKLCFGGEQNDGQVEVTVEKGDAIVVPAGVGHRLLADIEGGFEMVGSYPHGKKWDMCYGTKDEEKRIEAIQQLGWSVQDPIYGGEGPCVAVE